MVYERGKLGELTGYREGQHYRSWIIWRCPSVRFLDYQKVKDVERSHATSLFGTIEEPSALASKVYYPPTPLCSLSPFAPFPALTHLQLTDHGHQIPYLRHPLNLRLNNHQWRRSRRQGIQSEANGEGEETRRDADSECEELAGDCEVGEGA